MAREHARVLTRIWSDTDWRDLPPAEQRMYFLLMSQGNVTQAGVLPLQTRKWAKGSTHTSEDDIAAAVKGLEATNFVVVDEDTEELLIRSFIRNDGVAKIPNVFKAALRAAVAVESPKLRKTLAIELRRMRRKDAIAVADELSPTESPNGSETRTNENPEPIANPSETNSESLKVPDGIPELPGEGEGEGEGEPSVGGWVGRTDARSPVTDDRPETWQAPSSRCPRHRNDSEPPPCRACGDARRARERFDAEDAARRRTAVRACQLCDGDGWRFQPGRRLVETPYRRCDHRPEQAAS